MTQQPTPNDVPLTKDEALAFLAAWRQMFAGKAGFRHFTADLDKLADYIRRTDEPKR